MIAVDSNVLLRYAAQDDPEQARIASSILSEACFISASVLLETAWVLRSRMGVRRSDLADILAGMAALPTVTLEHEDGMAWAIGQFRAGADLADMIHVACAESADTFATFDRKIARYVDGRRAIAVRTLS